MSDVIVLYKTKYGSSKKYATWIAEEVGAEIFNVDDFNPGNLKNYDVIVYGGSLHATGIIGLSKISKSIETLNNKKVIVFSVGASPAKPEVLEDIKAKNFTLQMASFVEFYHLRGGFDFKKLKLIDKILMSMLKMKLKAKEKRGEGLTNDEKGMLAAYGSAVDFTSRKAIEPIVESISRFLEKTL
ncbi:MAG: flavodoxin [Kosmotogaceae bacterium]|nr:flavodoxin [Kosmotogaceae bacterium]